MQDFKINRRLVVDQTLWVKADSAEEAMRFAKIAGAEVVAVTDADVVKATYRHEGRG